MGIPTSSGDLVETVTGTNHLVADGWRAMWDRVLNPRIKVKSFQVRA